MIFKGKTTNSRETGGVSELNEVAGTFNEEMIPNEPVHEEMIPEEQVEGPVLRDRAQIKPPSRYRDYALLSYNELSTSHGAVHFEYANEWRNALVTWNPLQKTTLGN